MKQQWQQWNEREQLAVVIAAVCVVLYLLYAVLFSPLNTAVSNAHKQWQEKSSTLVWIRHAQQNYHQVSRPQPVTADSLPSLLTKLLKAASFHRFPYQLTQTDGGEIQLSFTEVPYNAFIIWLREQTAHYALTIKSLTVSKTPTSGVVKITITFSPG